eukprot:9150952-Prorocentrum_lima.AAC.1
MGVRNMLVASDVAVELVQTVPSALDTATAEHTRPLPNDGGDRDADKRSKRSKPGRKRKHLSLIHI